MADNPQKEAKKWANGKYSTPEEMEQGLMNLVPEFDRIKQEARASQERAMRAEAEAKAAREVFEAFQEQMRSQREEPQSQSFYREDGSLDDRAIQGYIDKRLAGVEKKLSGVGEIVEERLRGIFQPFTAAQAAKTEYVGQHPDYDDNVINKFLAANPGINRTFQRLVGNPETAESAYEYAHGMFKASMPKTSAVDEGKKRDAGAPAPASGPSLATDNPEAPTAEHLRQLAIRAQNTYSPEDELQFAKDYFKGTKVLSDIESLRPDWAKDRE